MARQTIVENPLTRFFSRVLLARFAVAALVLAVGGPAFAAPPKFQAAHAERLAQAAPAVAPPSAAAEAPPPGDPAAILDSVKQSLDKIDVQLAVDSMTDKELVKLRSSLDPISGQIEGVISDVSPKLAAVKARLDQLGPPPDPKANPPAAPEDHAVTQERVDQQKLYAARDDLIKRANVAQLRADQLAAQIADRRHALFASAVFQTSSSILSPNLWMDAVHDMPRGLSAARVTFSEVMDQASDALSGRSAWLFGLSLIALGAFVAGAIFVARRVIPREKTGRPPDELQKAAAALWTAFAIAAIPIAGATALYTLASWFGLAVQDVKPLSDALFRGAVGVALTIGLGVAILAPNRPLWRPIDLSDRVAQRLMKLLIVLIVLITLGKLFEAFDDVIGASLPVSVAARGIFALLVGGTLVRGLYGIVAPPENAEDSDRGHPPNLEDESPWWPAIRFAAWAATIAVIGADLFGYIALSSFIVDQIAWATFVASLLFLFQKMVSEALERAFRPNSRLSRALLASVGLRRESLAQIGVLMSGVVTLTLFAVAGLLILAPWGLQSHDMVGAIESAFFGFKVGDVTISPWGLLIALGLFAAGYTITHTIQNWLEKRYLPLTQIDQGLKASIRTSVGYVGLLLSLLFAVAFVGINLEKVALVVSALSVGIGLGLQGVVNNFVSGLILLWERAVRVGDLVVIGEDQGVVRRINVRATEIETPDRATMIVPNGNLMAGVVKNFVRGDRLGRIKIPVQVVPGSDPEKIREILVDAAKSHEEIVGIPAPLVLFTSFGSSSLDFELVCFVEDVERSGRIKSDLLYAIYRGLADAQVQLATTSTSLDLDVSQIEPLIERYFAARPDIKT